MAARTEQTLADDPDIDQLARQYLDLWQDHLKTMAADPQVAETMSQVTQMMTGQAAAFAALAQQSLGSAGLGAPNPAMQMMWPGAMTQPPPKNGSDNDDANDTPDDRSRPQAAAAAHGGSDIDLAELARRLDGIERRLAALEAGVGGADAGSGTSTRKSGGKSKS